MNFGEMRFWALFAGALCVVLGLRLVAARTPSFLPKFDKMALACLGLFLLWCVSFVTFAIYLFVLLVTFAGLSWIVRSSKHSFRWLLLLIPFQLTPLIYYKYAGFVYNNILGFAQPDFLHMLIPVGISFYTFQKIAFVIDTLVHKQPIPKFLDYLNFAGFFPQIVAGPIERRENLLPQMEKFRFRWSSENLDVGLRYVALGLFFKCCLADNLASALDRYSTTNPFQIWIANLVFGLRIYYDFAGYSLIAVGLGRCLGVVLTLNFLSPYTSGNVVEFWRRWHITLSQWFRDYLYVPLGGGRVRWWAFNVALVFVVSGIWHGAGWNFLFWGALHGIFLIGSRLIDIRLPKPAAWFLTMVACFFAWLCFYETDTAKLLQKITTLWTPSAYSLTHFKETLRVLSSPQSLVFLCFLGLTGIIMVLEWQSIARRDQPYSLLLQSDLGLAALVVLAIFLAPGQSNDFIYFAF